MDSVTEDYNSLADSDTQDQALLAEEYFSLFNKYAHNEIGAYMVLIVMPGLATALNIEKLKEHLYEYPPLVQLLIISYSLSLQSGLIKPDEKFLFAMNANSPVEAFPGKIIHAMHYKIFWVMKSLTAMWNEDEVAMAHYHSLITVTGIGGKLKHTYALYLAEWLGKNFLLSL